MNMIHNIHSGAQQEADKTTLHHNKSVLGLVQDNNSSFHHKKKIVLCSFDEQVVALFYQHLSDHVRCSEQQQVSQYIQSLKRSEFCAIVEAIQQKAFDYKATKPDLVQNEFISDDEAAEVFEAASNAHFLQLIVTYKTLKFAIKHADIGLIQQVIAQCCLLFQNIKLKNYVFLSFYLLHLINTAATTPELQKAILASDLVNLSDRSDEWFEIDHLNEFLNLQLKKLIHTR